MNHNAHRRLLTAVTLMLISGCGPGRDYQKPKVDTPTSWQVETPAEATSLPRWWTSFGEQRLDSLIDTALEQNLDVKLAMARIDEAKALRGVVEWRRLPDVDAVASGTRSRTSENTGMPALMHNQFEAGFDATWEIDLFGVLDRARERSDAQLQAVFAARGEVLSSIAAETARAYFDLVSSTELLAIANEDLDLQRQIRDLAVARAQGGISNEADVAQAEAEVATQEALLPDLEVRRSDAISRLSVLTSHSPSDVFKVDSGDRLPLETIEKLPQASAIFSAGLPSDLVWRRPDLRRAEREYAAAVAEIGVVERDLYPRFSLTGSFGLQSERSDQLAHSGSQFWSIGPEFRWPLLQRGRVKNEARAADARASQAEIIYQRNVIAAFAEVEQVLATLARAQERVRASDAAAAANRKALELVQTRYENGAEPLLSVLIQSRAAALARRFAIESRRTMALTVVALAKALGGGWDPQPPQSQSRQ